MSTTPAVLAPVRRGRLHSANGSKRAARDAEDRELIRRAQTDPDPRVRAQTVEAFMPLAKSLARRYHRGEEPLEDLEQVAALGLLKAVKGYDPDRGSAFASFAVPTIVGELRRHFRDKGWAIRVPRDLQELALAVQRKADVMNTEIGKPPTAEQLAERLGRDVEDILEAREALRAMRPPPWTAPPPPARTRTTRRWPASAASTPATSARRRPSRSAASSRTSPSASGASWRCASAGT